MATIGDALTLRPDDDGRWLAHADPDHQSITGMFGGWTAGILLGAVIQTSDGTAAPPAITVNYIGAIPAGDKVVVKLERIYAPSPQGLQSDLRHISGTFGSGDSRDSMWVRDVSGRPLDHPLLTYFADQYAPRSFFWGDGSGPSATISMSVYFHATVEEIAAVGDDYILNEATGTRDEHSTSGQQARLWSRGGTLLATTEQLCWYR